MITIVYNLLYRREGKYVDSSILAGTLDFIAELMLIVTILEGTRCLH